MIFRLFFYSLLAVCLPACSGLNGAVADAARAYYSAKNPPDFQQTALKPGLTYLEVRMPSASALLVLAEVDKAAKPLPGAASEVETWVSGSSEIIRTRAGFFTGNSGVAALPEQIDLQAGANAGLQGMVLSQPSLGAYNVPINLSKVEAGGLKLSKAVLLPRAQQIGGLVLNAWRGSSPVGAFDGSVHLVGTHPQTGRLVYGLHCFQPTHCIEFLARTAEQNL